MSVKSEVQVKKSNMESNKMNLLMVRSALSSYMISNEVVLCCHVGLPSKIIVAANNEAFVDIFN